MIYIYCAFVMEESVVYKLIKAKPEAEISDLRLN